MNDRGHRRTGPRLILVAALVVLAALVVAGLFAGGQAGMLPWQPEPTRIPIAPFEGLGAPTPAP
jgi:hypothetical protein